MLAQQRGRSLRFDVSGCKPHGDIDRVIAAQFRVFDGWEHAEFLGVGVLGNFVQAHHRTPDQSGLVKDFAPVVPGLGRQGLIKNTNELCHVFVAGLWVDKAFVFDDVIETNGLAQA